MQGQLMKDQPVFNQEVGMNRLTHLQNPEQHIHQMVIGERK